MNFTKIGTTNIGGELSPTPNFIEFNAKNADKVFEIINTAPILPPNKKHVSYLNIPAAFDTEWTSFMEGDVKKATLYMWMLGVGSNPESCPVIYGRTTESYQDFIYLLHKNTCVCDEIRLVVYVHFLSADIQFIRRWFDWDTYLCDDSRKFIFAVSDGIEYRCSLKLSGGRSLESVGNELRDSPVRKLTGELDYNLLRNSKTYLFPHELAYCENDVRVILAYIKEKLNDDTLSTIPITNTGYVRRATREACLEAYNYRNTIKKLNLTPELYNLAIQAFRGGDAHANPFYVGKTLSNVRSFDISSSYLGVICMERFPMSTPERADMEVTETQLDNMLRGDNFAIFTAEFTDLVPLTNITHPLSASKCWPKVPDATQDNGRVTSADYICTAITEVDWSILRRYYTWSSCKIRHLFLGQKNYLPTVFIRKIAKDYEGKTTLKGATSPEDQIRYAISKNMVLSNYGMMVTNPVRDEWEFNNSTEESAEVFTKSKPDLEEAIRRYNNNPRRFLYYLWGVYVTAYARYNLYEGIEAVGKDFVYCDTDSVKFLNGPAHEEAFRHLNAIKQQKLEAAARVHHFNADIFSPSTRDGIPKPLGYWDDEGTYDQFKTLGSKRYLVRTGDHYTLTVAGVNKKHACEYLVNTGNPFKNFSADLIIPAAFSGRNVHTYLDKEMSGTLTDYQGNTAEYHELSGLHIGTADYNLSMADDFVQYLMHIGNYEFN